MTKKNPTPPAGYVTTIIAARAIQSAFKRLKEPTRITSATLNRELKELEGEVAERLEDGEKLPIVSVLVDDAHVPPEYEIFEISEKSVQIWVGHGTSPRATRKLADTILYMPINSGLEIMRQEFGEWAWTGRVVRTHAN